MVYLNEEKYNSNGLCSSAATGRLFVQTAEIINRQIPDMIAMILLPDNKRLVLLMTAGSGTN